MVIAAWDAEPHTKGRKSQAPVQPRYPSRAITLRAVIFFVGRGILLTHIYVANIAARMPRHST
jgi:hypothetical protein